jgi:HD-like signal output (HDOD) protein
MTPEKDRFFAAIAQTERLVPAPRTLGRALLLLHDPESNLDEISNLISCDAALAADILRCANSAYYGGGGIAAIDAALQKIGFRETLRLLNLAVAHQTTHRDLGSYGIAADDFWAESLFSGLFLERLARHIPSLVVDEAYTTGLLRFIGRLAINQAIHDLGAGLFWNSVTPLPDWEREHIGLTQADAGGLLLRQWEFPAAIVEAVQRQDEVATDAPASALVRAMQLTVRVLPPGTDLNLLDPLQEAEPVFPSGEPLFPEQELPAEALRTLLQETHTAYLEIRQELYR